MQSQWSQSRIPPTTDIVFRLLSLLVLSFLVQWVARGFLDASVIGSILRFDSGFRFWQIFTHPLVFPGNPFSGAMQLLFHGIILWSFGGELERLFGSYHFLRLFLFGILGAILASAALALTLLLPGLIVAGFGGGLAATMIAYAFLWPDREVLLFFVIPMKMKWVVIILLVMIGVFNPDQILIYSGGSLAGALFIFYYAKKGRIYQLSSSTIPYKGKPGPSLKERLEEFRKKRRLRKKQEVINERIRMKDEVDRLLEKISKDGIKSLSRKEKSFLDKASKEF